MVTQLINQCMGEGMRWQLELRLPLEYSNKERFMRSCRGRWRGKTRDNSMRAMTNEERAIEKEYYDPANNARGKGRSKSWFSTIVQAFSKTAGR